MYGRENWGGSFEITSEEEQQRNKELDQSPYLERNNDTSNHNNDNDGSSLRRNHIKRLDLDETQQSWLLGPQEAKKKKKYVDLGCVVISAHLFKNILISLFVVSAIVGGIVLISKLVPKKNHDDQPPDSYSKALHLALKFFNIQKSGKLPKSNNITWRGDSALNDKVQAYNLVGGYYDAGDHIKFSFTTAFSMTLLSWSVLEYSPKYSAIGELDHVKELIRWGNDYLLKTFNASAPSVDKIFCMIGKASVNSSSPDDHFCWTRPEDMDYKRPVTECRVGSDLGAEMAAATAAASIVFRNEDPGYSEKLANASEKLFAFARDSGKRGSYRKNNVELARLYNSSNYYDDYVWGATWVFLATGNSSYLKLATTKGIAVHAQAFSNSFSKGVFSWDNKLPGAQVLLSRIRIFLGPGYPYEEMLSTYQNQTGVLMCSYLPSFDVFNRTRGGLIQLNYWQPQPLQYTVNAVFLATVFGDYLESQDIPGWFCGPYYFDRQALRNFATSQMDYILGENPKNLSYVVGYGEKYPRHVHHRAGSIPKDGNKYSCRGGWKWRDSSRGDPNVVMGAMVGGPDRFDGFQDVRKNYNYTEPSIVGNAGLVSALVALTEIQNVSAVDRNSIFASVPPLSPPAPPPPKRWVP